VVVVVLLLLLLLLVWLLLLRALLLLLARAGVCASLGRLRRHVRAKKQVGTHKRWPVWARSRC